MPWTYAFLAALAASLVLGFKSRRESGADLGPWLACLSLTLFLSTFRWHGGDDLCNSLLPFSIVRHQTLTLEPFRGWLETRGLLSDFTVRGSAPLLSIFPIAPGLLALPVFLPAALSSAPISEPLLHNFSKIAASLLSALCVLLLHQIASRRASRPWAACVTALYALGTFTFSVGSQALYQHGPAQLGLLLGFWGWEQGNRRGEFLSGLGFALAVACRTDSVFFLAAACAFALLRRRERAGAFLAGASLPLLLLAAYWFRYTGRLHPPESGLQFGLFGRFQAAAAAGMLASPTRGLLLFCPASLFGLWALASRRFRGALPWAPYLLAACAAQFLFFCFYVNWTAGQSFGPRYLSSSCAVLTLACVAIEEPVRRSPLLLGAWSAALALSILVHLHGGYFQWPGSSALDVQRAQLWDWSLYPPAQLFAPEGPLRKIPLRPLAAFALLFVAAALGRTLARRLKWTPA